MAKPGASAFEFASAAGGSARHAVTYKRALALLRSLRSLRWAACYRRTNRPDQPPETMAENDRTPKQQIAELQAKINRLKAKETALENGQKIILGGMLLAAARKDQRIRQWVIKEAQQITRPADVKRITPLLEELRAIEAGGST